jgi:histone acetyltransferase
MSEEEKKKEETNGNDEDVTDDDATTSRKRKAPPPTTRTTTEGDDEEKSADGDAADGDVNTEQAADKNDDDSDGSQQVKKKQKFDDNNKDDDNILTSPDDNTATENDKSNSERENEKGSNMEIDEDDKNKVTEEKNEEDKGEESKNTEDNDQGKNEEKETSSPQKQSGSSPRKVHTKAAASASVPAVSSSKSNPYETLKYTMITNDGKPESLIKLVALKSLFAKQLPKMPRAYIARLVFDRRHTSLAILNDDPATKDTDEEVIGSICYRPFYDMRFAEIAFCAVNASHQVKGYGTKLMNLVKQQGARTGIEYFITYADNYAVGYFKKQGFTKSISMPKGRYQGHIKDYDGGTLMECYVHPSIDFTRIPEMLAAQREFILSRIRLKAQSTKVYDPLPKDWSPNIEGVSRVNEAAARALAIPGMVEAGWTMADLLAATGQGKDLDRAKSALKNDLLGIVRSKFQKVWKFQ